MRKTKSLFTITEKEFKLTFETYFSSLCVFADKFLKNPDLAKDLAQEAFVKVWKRRTEFESQNSIKAYLYITVRNGALDHLRHLKVRGEVSKILIREEFTEHYYIQEVIREETYRMLKSAIQRLSNKERGVIELNLKGLSNQEIADKLGLSINTIKTQKLHAYKKLRKLLGNQFVMLILTEFYNFFE